MAPTLCDLPDGCLETVLVAATDAADSNALNNVMCTCKRFLRLVSSPTVPRNVTVRVPANTRFPALRDCPGVTTLVTSEWPVPRYEDRVTALTRLELYLDVHTDLEAPLPATLHELRFEDVYADGPYPRRDFGFLSTLTSLKSLTVYSEHPIADHVVEPLTALRAFHAFSWMGCSANLMAGRDNLRELGWCHHSAPLPRLPSELTSLSVRAEIDTLRDMNALAWFPLQHLRSLTVLVHHGEYSDTDGLGLQAFFTRLPDFVSLTKLYLSYGITDLDQPSVEDALGAVARLPNLVDLWLDVDLFELELLSPLTSLTSLAFRSWHMTNFSPLASLVNLELLHLQPLSMDEDMYMHPRCPDDVPFLEPVKDLPAYLPPLPALRELRMELPRLPQCMRLYYEPNAVRFVHFSPP